MIEVMEQRLEMKKKRLEQLQEYFRIDIMNINQSTYEDNAISALLEMKKIKTEIAELELCLQLKWLIYVKKKGRDCMSNRPSYYRNDEIKYKIDTAIQMVMFEKGKENWDTLLEVQDKLYDEFGLSIE